MGLGFNHCVGIRKMEMKKTFKNLNETAAKSILNELTWWDFYFVVITVLYIIWRAVVFLKRFQ